MNYLVIIEKGRNNFSAYSPDMPGCVAAGKTIEITLRRMQEALYLHLEDLYQQGEPLPNSQSLKSHIEEIDIQAGDMFTFVQVDLNIMSEAA